MTTLSESMREAQRILSIYGTEEKEELVYKIVIALELMTSITERLEIIQELINEE